MTPRLKIHLIVKDYTGEAKFMLLDLVANGLISESATELFNRSFEEPEDPKDLPPPINQIVGKTFAFGIYVEKDHIVYGADIYKVGKVFKDRMEYHSNRTSGEEVMSTPSIYKWNAKTMLSIFFIYHRLLFTSLMVKTTPGYSQPPRKFGNQELFLEIMMKMKIYNFLF